MFSSLSACSAQTFLKCCILFVGVTEIFLLSCVSLITLHGVMHACIHEVHDVCMPCML